jgi:hypothetical protein
MSTSSWTTKRWGRQAGRLWEGSCFTMQVPVQAEIALRGWQGDKQSALCLHAPTSPNPAADLPQTVDPRQLQISLTGFLEKNTSLFCKVGPAPESAYTCLLPRPCLHHAWLHGRLLNSPAHTGRLPVPDTALLPTDPCPVHLPARRSCGAC